ncbi:phosphoribosylanthranilate isomerase [Enhygromyxa salina]|uniref:N-(5'-phosphoribosyl)anthranilate isomerase n=1 Tax=Enhygromyxa salina TaxID=215803 RepID=A0A2S9Y3B3_9BACT|nr:phosphoribosylanthranilate isomerase [Enhygromyxa salina]PRP99586.1 N-(5'-phosphoribosyl)anthranilate isomerase [Enhygromyxa salina]
MAVGLGLKICGLTRAEDLRACVELGVDAIGLNLWPSSRRYVDPVAAAELLAVSASAGEADRPAPARVGVFVNASLADTERAIAALDLDLIQPHGDAPVEPYAELAARYEIGWIWVVRGTPALAGLKVPTPAPRWVLLDAAVAGFGGAGQPTDWGWAAEAVAALAPLPVWLAGGITPQNAAQAIAAVRPAGLDVASGAEPPGGVGGHKQRSAIAALVDVCRASGR